jgi:hypothetical protein
VLFNNEPLIFHNAIILHMNFFGAREAVYVTLSMNMKDVPQSVVRKIYGIISPSKMQERSPGLAYVQTQFILSQC